MKNKIEKFIEKELKSVLGEIDIQATIDGLTDKNRIKSLIDHEIKDLIRQKVAESIETAIYKAIQKNQPLVDAYTADAVKVLMFRIDEATNPLKQGRDK